MAVLLVDRYIKVSFSIMGKGYFDFDIIQDMKKKAKIKENFILKEILRFWLIWDDSEFRGYCQSSDQIAGI